MGAGAGAAGLVEVAACLAPLLRVPLRSHALTQTSRSALHLLDSACFDGAEAGPGAPPRPSAHFSALHLAL